MAIPAETHRREPRFLLMYSALQFAPQDTVKPDGSLSLPYVAGALRDAGFEVRILDASVGADGDALVDTFYKPTPLASGLIRIGMSPERIAQEIADYDVIGISSIFTVQTTMVLELIQLVKNVDPAKLVITGGVNARYLMDRFFASGADIICLSEAEKTVVQIGNTLRRGEDLAGIPGTAVRLRNGKVAVNPAQDIVYDLDGLPDPAWDLLPLERYWQISRPHGGDFPSGMRIQYASMMTSRGCPFSCSYCHISKETKGSLSGELGGLRLKSFDRVMREVKTLKGLGAEYIFFEDDSLLAKKKRAQEIFLALKGQGLNLVDVNGVNLCHLFRNDRAGHLVVDRELLEVMAECGFKMIALPFESGCQRIIDKYASGKWRIDKCDTVELIRVARDLGIIPLGSYTIGYPDETFEEVTETIMLAKRHVDEGLAVASFFVIVPFPGTTLYDMVIQTGQLSTDFNPDQMKWTSSILRNTPVSAEALERVRTIAWRLINRSDLVRNKERIGFKALAAAAS